jgi:hypothetical protein
MRQVARFARLAVYGVGIYFLYRALTAPSTADAIAMIAIGVLLVLVIMAIFGGIGIGKFVADKVVEHEKKKQA